MASNTFENCEHNQSFRDLTLACHFLRFVRKMYGWKLFDCVTMDLDLLGDSILDLLVGSMHPTKNEEPTSDLLVDSITFDLDLLVGSIDQTPKK